MINFKQYPSITKIIIPKKAKLSNNNFHNMFNNMRNLQEIKLSDDISNITNTFTNCTNLITPVCGPNVTIMNRSYQYCTNIITPVCGPNVTNMVYTYYSCFNINTAVCGPNVINMHGPYQRCNNLTTAVCGPNVKYMVYTYENCNNLITAVCGPNVTNLCGSWGANFGAYENCPNIQGNAYFYSNYITSVRNCFNGRNTSNMLNIYVHNNTKSMNVCLTSNNYSLIGASITWTNDSANNRYYNTSANIYIYPVANINAARNVNGD